MTLYLKYRPQTIEELDLESVRDGLKNIIKSGNVPHAFLFSGPKGTGKTSAARILAKIINCTAIGESQIEPCNKCSQCISITKGNNIDVIELDAASNRGIDDIRSLKEGIYLAPGAAKKKVYIIDEAHMLTLEAANAFLKTLEEPPDHVVFILATTNPEKLPQTVLSRLTRVNFTKATAKDVSRQLKRVAKGEKIEINNEAIERISKLADGSFRDAVKILETLSFRSKKIGEADVVAVFADSGPKTVEFFTLLRTGNAQKTLEFVEKLVEDGISIKNFVRSILEELHASLLAKNGVGEDRLEEIALIDLIILIDLIEGVKNQNSFPEQLALEVAVVRYCQNNHNPPLKESPLKVTVVPPKESPLKRLDEETWQKLLLAIHEKNISIEALLRGAKPLGFDGTILALGVYYKFHKDKLLENKNMKILEDTCKEVFNIPGVKLNLELIERPRSTSDRKPPVASETLTPAADKDIIDAAKEIFG